METRRVGEATVDAEGGDAGSAAAVFGLRAGLRHKQDFGSIKTVKLGENRFDFFEVFFFADYEFQLVIVPVHKCLDRLYVQSFLFMALGIAGERALPRRRMSQLGAHAHQITDQIVMDRGGGLDGDVFTGGME